MDIYYIRHGEPDYQAQNQPLTKIGHKQARAVSKFLSKIDFDLIFSSPLLRARQTASYTCKKLNKDYIVQDWCSEKKAIEDVGYRDENGRVLNWIMFHQEIQDDINRLIDDSNWYNDPVFKNRCFYERGRDRVLSSMKEWMKEYLNVEFDGEHFKALGETPKNIAIFAHGGFATLFFSTILHSHYLKFIKNFNCLELAGVAHLRIDFDSENPKVEVLSYNDIYYDSEMRYKDIQLEPKWKLYYADDKDYHGKINLIYHFDHFDNVKIPTLFEWELFKNRKEKDPYYSTYIWDYQKYESYHQFYVLNFSSTRKHKILKLNGIDTISEVFVNGKLIGKTDNMFIPYLFELDNLKKENNELIIHILPSVLEGKKYGYDPDKVYAMKYNHEGLYIRKSAHSFGWDILPRTPLGGIYKNVEFINKLPLIKDVHISSYDISKESATLKFDILLNNDDIKNYEYTIEGKCKTHSFFRRSNKIKLHKPKLWNIKYYGEPNLYKIIIKIYKDNKVIATKKINYGIRKVELFRTSNVEENGKFEFHINGEKVFLIGANWTPVDAISHLNKRRMLKAVDLLDDLGCNVARIWGGGSYELDEFYDECDKRGIFVWHDFMMGCAIYPNDLEFQKKIKKEVEYIVPHLRNHPSICLWSGDNECDIAAARWIGGNKFNPGNNVLTRKVIPNLLKKLDDQRPYLPSSPYFDEYAYAHVDEQTSEDHVWGPRDYFKGEYYANSQCYFVSETGYHSLNDYESLTTYLKNPWPLFEGKMKINEKTRLIEEATPTKEYLAHATSVVDDINSPYAYRIMLMANQVRTLFVDELKDPDDFIFASQASQGEAMKYFIERMRKNYSRNGGIIWWNLLDGWPQPSDAVVDYYFRKKNAYYYIKRSQQKNLFMLEEENNKLNLYWSSLDSTSHTFKYQIIDAYNNEKIIDEGVVTTQGHSSQLVKAIKADYRTLLIIKYVDETGKEYINHFHTHIRDLDFKKYKDAINKYDLLK